MYLIGHWFRRLIWLVIIIWLMWWKSVLCVYLVSYWEIFEKYWNILEGYQELSQYLRYQLRPEKGLLLHLVAVVGYKETEDTLRPTEEFCRKQKLQNSFSPWDLKKQRMLQHPQRNFVGQKTFRIHSVHGMRRNERYFDPRRNSVGRRTLRTSQLPGIVAGLVEFRQEGSSGGSYLEAKYEKARKVSTNNQRELSKDRQWFSDGRSCWKEGRSDYGISSRDDGSANGMSTSAATRIPATPSAAAWSAATTFENDGAPFTSAEEKGQELMPLSPYVEGEDVEAFPATFERTMCLRETSV